MATEKKLQKTPKFICNKCDFTSSKQNEYERHIDTNKHKRLHGLLEKTPITEPKTFNCICGKEYNHHTSLAKHKRKCIKIHAVSVNDIDKDKVNYNDTDNTNAKVNDNDNNNDNDNDNSEDNVTDTSNQNIAITRDMFMRLLKNNEEMLKIIKSLSETKNGSNVVAHTINDNSINNSNNHNNTFNMNLFLNEKCKDAMNMKDFVNSIQLNITDLENVGRLGYVEGMSNILIDNLEKTDLHKRPVHCSDVKRETLYVKDDNKWEREGPNHEKMVNAVLAVEHKNVALVSEWAKAHPSCMNSNTRDNETYFKLSKAATDGDKEGNIAKVIRKVAKRVAIEKE